MVLKTLKELDRYKEDQIKKSNHKCNICGKKKDISDLEADHIKPISLGGAMWDLSNIQILCKKCHVKKTNKETKTLRKLKKIPQMIKSYCPECKGQTEILDWNSRVCRECHEAVVLNFCAECRLAFCYHEHDLQPKRVDMDE